MELELNENESALVIAHHQEVDSVTTHVVSGGRLDSLQSHICYAISEKFYGDNIFWKEVFEHIETQKKSVLSEQVKQGGMATLANKIENDVATLVFEKLKDGRMAVYMGTDNKYAPPYDICKALEDMFIEDESFREHLYSYWDDDDEELPEIPEIQEKKYRVREFPIFHRFLVTLFHREQLAIRLKYKELFRRIGEWEVVRLCSCDDPTCATVILKRDESDVKLKEDVSLHIDCSNFTFGTDGSIDMENLGNFPYQFPFRQELKDVMSGKPLGWWYGENRAQLAVDSYFKNKKSSYKSGYSMGNLGYKIVSCGDEDIVVWDDII